jgi:biopolymer transport protein ExbB
LSCPRGQSGAVAARACWLFSQVFPFLGCCFGTRDVMFNRLCAWLALAIVWGTFVFPMVSTSWAQDDNPAAAAESEAKADDQQVESGIHWFIRCSGLIGLLIFGLSVYFVALVIRLFMNLKPEVAVPMDVSADFQETLAQGNMEQAYEMVRESESFLGKVVAKGIEHLANGLQEARHAMERTGEAETVRMEKQISMMAVLGTLGPMIGLIGTLKGMIASFSVIARGGVSLKASEVAGGISEALLLTFEGVALSVPAIYFFSLFRNKVSHLSSWAMLEADQFLRHFAHAARSKSPAGGPPAAPAKAAKPS